MMKKEKIYLDTSVPSAYYDDRIPYQRDLTRRFWEEELGKYQVYASDITLLELSNTREENKRRKLLELMADIQIVSADKKVIDLAEKYVNAGIIPRKYFEDALHLSFVVIYKIDYLVTFNCKHLVGVHKRKMIREYHEKKKLRQIEIATPEEFLEEE